MTSTGGSALLVVDVQRDFCAGGALAVPGGDEVVPVINALISHAAGRGEPVFASRDWHPPDTRHFATRGGPWPVHCVAGSPGAMFHERLRLPAGAPVVTKGDSREDDGYSAFEGRLPSGRSLIEELRRLGIAHLYVGGLATDYCVRHSVLDALKAGLEVTVVLDAVRGVDVRPGDSDRALQEMRSAGATTRSLERVIGSRGGDP